MISLSHVFTSPLPSGLFGNNLDLQQVSWNQNLPKHSPRLFLAAGCHVWRSDSVTHCRHGHCARCNGAYDMQEATERGWHALTHPCAHTWRVDLCQTERQLALGSHTVGRGCWRPTAPARANSTSEPAEFQRWCPLKAPLLWLPASWNMASFSRESIRR